VSFILQNKCSWCGYGVSKFERSSTNNHWSICICLCTFTFVVY